MNLNNGELKGQLTLRGIIVGSIGAAVITMSSMYVALKLGALPWPIIFVALASMFFLKLMGNTNVNEINVTHTIMSAGAMTAGGLAFTIPGIYILNPNAEINIVHLLFIVLGGVILGLIFTAIIRKFFIESHNLPYPMGQAAAETILIGDEGGKKSITLFASMGASAIFTFLRDFFSFIPQSIMNPQMLTYGSYAGISLSPMLIAVGYIIGPASIAVLLLGGIFGDFGLLMGGVKLGIYDSLVASDLKSSLGIGVMVGTGIGIIIKGILPKFKEIFGSMFSKSSRSGSIINLRWAPFVMAALAAIFAFICNMGIVASIITILGVWLTTSMSAQVVGQSGINPMEVFGIIVLIIAQQVSRIGQTEAFFVAAVVAIGCGLAGDIMNDFKAGHILKSNPKAQWIGECIGGIIGALVSVGVFYAITAAYGTTAFGSNQLFAAPQASAVAAMVGGIPNNAAFIIGLIAGCFLYCINFPVMMLGLGIYLPFYLTLTVSVGGALKFIAQKAAPKWDKGANGMIISSGLLGGEAVVGVIIALMQAIPALLALS